ncbi:MAG: replication-relaxation family protein [Actinobacteria bacterium]|nr:replication-relaxation family protein [Actinomycetota bacterium]
MNPLDKDLFQSLYTLDVLTIPIAAQMLSSAADPKNGARTVGQHLHKLRTLGLADYVERKRKLRIYYLTELGRFLGGVLATGRWDAVGKVKDPLRGGELLRQPYTNHFLEVAEIAASFSYLRDRQVGRLEQWHGDYRERPWECSWLGVNHRLYPDGRGFVTDENGGAFSFLLELERNNPKQDEAVEKFRKYCLMQVTREYTRRTGEDKMPPVLVVVVSPYKSVAAVETAVVAGTLQARLTISDASRRIVFAIATLTAIRDHGPYADIWRCPVQALSDVGFYELYGILRGDGRVVAS